MRSIFGNEHGAERFQRRLKRGDYGLVRGAEAALEQFYPMRVHP
jgi:hypothetical protein